MWCSGYGSLRITDVTPKGIFPLFQLSKFHQSCHNKHSILYIIKATSYKTAFRSLNIFIWQVSYIYSLWAFRSNIYITIWNTGKCHPLIFTAWINLKGVYYGLWNYTSYFLSHSSKNIIKQITHLWWSIFTNVQNFCFRNNNKKNKFGKLLNISLLLNVQCLMYVFKSKGWN